MGLTCDGVKVRQTVRSQDGEIVGFEDEIYKEARGMDIDPTGALVVSGTVQVTQKDPKTGQIQSGKAPYMLRVIAPGEWVWADTLNVRNVELLPATNDEVTQLQRKAKAQKRGNGKSA